MSSPNQPGPAHYQPRKKRRVWPWIFGGLAALFVIGVIVPAAATAPAQTTVPPTTDWSSTPTRYTVAPQPAPAPTPPPSPVGVVSDGTYKVGEDIAAGQYKTRGDSEGYGDTCYYARMKNDSGDFGAIIANDLQKGPNSVTVKKGEFVEFTGGCTWTKQ